MQRRRRAGAAITAAAVCGLVALVLFAPFDQAEDVPVAPPIATPHAFKTVPREAMRAHDPSFTRLAAHDASLRDNFKAYDWIKECLMERGFEERKIRYVPRCGLSDAYVDDVELRKQLVARLARAGSFAAFTDVAMEGPHGLYKAFADDPRGHARLLDETYKIGLAKGEPAVLGAEAAKLEAEGDLLRFVPFTDTGRAKHTKALAYRVASALGLAKQQDVAGADAPNVQDVLREYEERLDARDRDAARAEGVRIAEAWHPLCPVTCQVAP